MNKLNRIVSIVVLACFVINLAIPDYVFALSPQVVSGNPDSPIRKDMFALGEKKFLKLIGPGAIDFEKYATSMTEFTGATPEIKNIEFVPVDYKNIPDGWMSNKMLKKGFDNGALGKDMSLIDALKYFAENEAQFKPSEFEIREGNFEVDRKNGEIPVSRYSYDEKDSKWTLVVHKDFVKMWRDIYKNDVWFRYTFQDGEERTVSLAWALFYRIAKHEMSDKKKLGRDPKSVGHMTSHRDGLVINSSELTANNIKGKYSIVNDACWMWFLGSYCFGKPTQYDNDILRKRLEWFFEGKDAREENLHLEFPDLWHSVVVRSEAIAIALMINRQYYSEGAEASKDALLPEKEFVIHASASKIVGTGHFLASQDIDGKLTVRDLLTGKNIVNNRDASKGFQLTATHVAFCDSDSRFIVRDLATGKDILNTKFGSENFQLTATHIALRDSGGMFTVRKLAKIEDIVIKKNYIRPTFKLTPTHIAFCDSEGKLTVHDFAMGKDIVKDRMAEYNFQLTSTHVAFRNFNSRLIVCSLATGEDVVSKDHVGQNFKLTPTGIAFYNSKGKLTVHNLLEEKDIIIGKRAVKNFGLTTAHIAFRDSDDRLTVRDLAMEKDIVKPIPMSGDFRLTSTHVAFYSHNELIVRDLVTGEDALRVTGAIEEDFELTPAHIVFRDSIGRYRVYALATGDEVIGLSCAPDIGNLSVKIAFTPRAKGGVIVSMQEPSSSYVALNELATVKSDATNNRC